MNCRHCGSEIRHDFLDLGYAPPSNAYLSCEDLNSPEVYLPLRVVVCHSCWLVQTEDYAEADSLFKDDYAYFSSTSTSFLRHAESYCAGITERLSLSPNSFVIEVASNDGYLLQNFVEAGVPCLGVEPTRDTARAARNLGIEVLEEFFSETVARALVDQGKSADLVIGNNVYAHVPDINDFTKGLAALLKPQGVITLEFPHALQLIANNQFDTIYHEHFSYLSLTAVLSIFEDAGLRVWDVDELPTHGGSIRVYGCLKGAKFEETPAVDRVLKNEVRAGLSSPDAYLAFQAQAESVKYELLEFLLAAKRKGKSIATYGAAAKGNTLLNYAGVKTDLIPYVCDAASAKQGKFLPGSHIPIASPDRLISDSLDYILVLPWNLIDEVAGQLAEITSRGTKLVTAIPSLKILD